jgi:hypothetical protein
MLVTVVMKHPDAVQDAILDAVEQTRPEDISDEEWGEMQTTRRDAVSRILEKWVEYGEYITVEFDTEAKTATVVPR